MSITRDDLRVNPPIRDSFYGDRLRKITDEEFDRLAGERTAELLDDPGVRSDLLRALLTDECECVDGIVWRNVPCEEHDHNPPLPANTSCTMSVAEEVRHEVCGGRGWLPKDAVVQSAHVAMVEYLMDHGMGQYPIDVVSALADGAFQAWFIDWLEAEDE